MQFELLKSVTTAPTTSAAAGSGLLVDSQAPDYNGGFSVQATVVGTGAVSATVLFQVSNDNVGWVTTATMTLLGTTSDTALVNITPSVFKGHIQNVVNYLRLIDPMCDLIFMGPPQQIYGTETPKNYVASDYSEAMYQLAQENYGSAFIDFESIFGAFGQSSVDSGFIHGDRVHPGTEGAKLIAKTISSVLLR